MPGLYRLMSAVEPRLTISICLCHGEGSGQGGQRKVHEVSIKRRCGEPCMSDIPFSMSTTVHRWKSGRLTDRNLGGGMLMSESYH
jgi:hypothetical protein